MFAGAPFFDVYKISYKYTKAYTIVNNIVYKYTKLYTCCNGASVRNCKHVYVIVYKFTIMWKVFGGH